MKTVNVVSVCCNAEVRVSGGIPDFFGEAEGCTRYYICNKCNEPCDIKEDKKSILYYLKQCKLIRKMKEIIYGKKKR